MWKHVGRFCVFSPWIACGLLGLWAIGCSQVDKTADAAVDKDKELMKRTIEVVMPVEVQTPARGTISSFFETSARVEAETRVDVVAEAVGKCSAVLAQEGQEVKKGDILAELEKDSALATAQQSEVQVRKSKADYVRAKELAKAGYISEAEYDAARFAYEQGEASLNLQKIQLENLTLRAPMTGVITRKNVQVGQIVTSGMPSFSIVDPSTFRLIINPPEKELPRLKVGQLAVAGFDALEGKEFDAKVSQISPSVDALSGTIKVTLEFDSGIRAQLREAVFARVKLILETRENALLIPKDALVEESARRFVYVIDDAPPSKEPEKSAESPTKDKADESNATTVSDEQEKAKYVAKRMEVEIGFEDSEQVEILSGIDDTVQVITVGQYNLKPGSPVRVTNSDIEMAAAKELSLDDALTQGREKRGDAPGQLERRHR